MAREFNQAETTFIMNSAGADYKLRSFTAAGAEVFGAGHNALGAWLWLGEHGRLGPLDPGRTFLQEIGLDILPIELNSTRGRVHGRMLQAPLRLPETIVDAAALASALGLRQEDLLPDPPPRAADTGAAHLMVRALDSVTVDRARPDADALLAETPAEGCYLYALDPASPRHIYARFFNPTVGLWEDAATGTGAGPLVAYLGSLGMMADGPVAVEQGTKMDRRSILEVRLMPEPELSGTGCIVLKGAIVV
jgi:PhzF family phenazine biosynthesis protein